MSARDDYPYVPPGSNPTGNYQRWAEMRDEIDTLRARLADQQAVIDAAVAWTADDKHWRHTTTALRMAVARLTDKGDG